MDTHRDVAPPKTDLPTPARVASTGVAAAAVVVLLGAGAALFALESCTQAPHPNDPSANATVPK